MTGGVAVSLELPADLLDAVARRAAELASERYRPRYLSRRALARHYGVSERTIRTWRERGLPGIRVGREVMYPLKECDRWIESHA